MSTEEPRNFVDRLVDKAAEALDALGLNGTRLRWKWNQRKRDRGEGAMQREMAWRGAKGRHKMCPSCRALVGRAERVCSECGRELGDVQAPGVGRALSNALPGIESPSALILLVNGFLFLLVLLAQAKTGEAGGGGLFGGFSGRLLAQFGSGYSPWTRAGDWWRLVTPIFLHGGLLHFFFNSWVLINLGKFAEREFGMARFWVIYLATGIVGSTVSQMLRTVNTVGASGAILGIAGLLLAHGWRRGDSFGELMKSSMLRFLAYILVFSLLFSGGIDHLNHACGLVSGIIFGLVIDSKPATGTARALWRAAAVAGVLLVVLCFGMVALHQPA